LRGNIIEHYILNGLYIRKRCDIRQDNFLRAGILGMNCFPFIRKIVTHTDLLFRGPVEGLQNINISWVFTGLNAYRYPKTNSIRFSLQVAGLFIVDFFLYLQPVETTPGL